MDIISTCYAFVRLINISSFYNKIKSKLVQRLCVVIVEMSTMASLAVNITQENEYFWNTDYALSNMSEIGR